MRLFGLVGESEEERRVVLYRLVAELSGRGIRVATLHEALDGFDPDRPGKDSYEHRKAGASEVLLMAPEMSALMHENASASPSLLELAALLEPADVILIDGFQASPHPKVRVGSAGGRCDASVVASLDAACVDIKALADLVQARAQGVAL
ncbi:MAG: molybdopterin-guanine dinucleotide biosynthesis protein MobB [Alphaproteobacteria bacterium]|nr:molybdopterin-guanine dinucleotide biosynthesis protein MobB [Alphaproteobacteria bacterium]